MFCILRCSWHKENKQWWCQWFVKGVVGVKQCPVDGWLIGLWTPNLIVDQEGRHSLESLCDFRFPFWPHCILYLWGRKRILMKLSSLTAMSHCGLKITFQAVALGWQLTVFDLVLFHLCECNAQTFDLWSYLPTNVRTLPICFSILSHCVGDAWHSGPTGFFFFVSGKTGDNRHTETKEIVVF